MSHPHPISEPQQTPKPPIGEPPKPQPIPPQPEQPDDDEDGDDDRGRPTMTSTDWLFR
jgi:hypothetical protein